MGQVHCRVQEPIPFSWLYWIFVELTVASQINYPLGFGNIEVV